MDRLVKEVRSTFASQSDITIETLKQMPYLNACVEEGLRCYPPVPVSMDPRQERRSDADNSRLVCRV